MADSWPATWPAPVRAAGEVQVWLVPLPLGEEPPAGWLSADEWARAARFVFDADRRRFVWARLALRALLGQARGEAPGNVPLELEPRGKPFVAGGPGASLSHAGAWGLVAIADGPVGCDLELVRDLPDLSGMARLVMDPRELSAWEPLDGPERVRAFFRAWTRKEALLKARGDGFLAEPRGVSVGVEPGRERGVTVDQAAWALRDLRPVPGVLAALATEGADQPRVRTFTLAAASLA